jgi:hypothetical protein
VRTYKFLARGARGPLSGFPWPEPRGSAPGAWVEIEGTLELGVRGAHVCRPADLAHWLHDELWEIEAGDDHIEGIDCLVVRRARLVRRIDAWHAGGAVRFAEACLARARELADRAPDRGSALVRGHLDDLAVAARSGYAALAAFNAALAVARLGDPLDEEETFRRERLWQAAWITSVLIDV